MRNNINLHKARKARADEFYTQYEDIEKEIQNYNLDGKKIYLNCDDYRHSNFVKYFKDNFSKLKIAYLTASNYDNGECAYKYEYDGVEEKITALKGNGDFRSEECVELLKEADVVITNPPFSLFREYIALLMKYDKKFIVIGNMNAITYKEIFHYIKNNELWLGMNYCKEFIQPDGTYKSFGNICWFTNIDNKKRNKSIVLYKKYSEEEYKKFDNYNAINCDKVADIPMDYDGVIGVPITFLDKFCPEQFEIVGWSRHNDLNMDGGYWKGGKNDATINGNIVYRRILIRKKN